MKWNGLFVFVCLMLSISVGCGGATDDDIFTFTFEGAVTPTSSAETLISLRMTQAARDIPLNNVAVFLSEPGKTIYSMEFELEEDINGDGKLGEGDLLSISEPANIIDETHIGKELNIELVEEGEGNIISTLHEEVWVP